MFGRLFKKKQQAASPQVEAGRRLACDVTEQAVEFYVVGDDGQRLPVEQWYFHNRVLPEETYASRVMILRQMQSDGLATVGSANVTVSTEDLYELPLAELLSLEIAPLWPHRVELTSHSDFGRNDFRCSVRFVDVAGRTLEEARPFGCLIQQGSYRWLAPPALRRLLERVKEINAASTYEERLVAYAEVKSAATAAEALLADEYLRSREVMIAESVGIDLTQASNGDLQLTPHLDGLDFEQEVLRQYRHRPQVPEAYDVVRKAGRRVTVVLRQEVRQALQEAKRCGRMRGQAKEAFLEQPNRYLQSAVLDHESIERQAATLRAPRFHAYLKPAEKPESLRIALEVPDVDLPGTIVSDVVLSREDARRLLGKVADARRQNKDQVELPQVGTVGDLWSFEKQLTEALSPEGPVAKSETNAPLQLPCSLSTGLTLMPHQLRCLEWLQSLLAQDAPGCLLADDMGLGKTLQVLTFFEWMRLSGRCNGPALLVAPIGLLENWKAEYFKFFAGSGALDPKDVLFLFGKALSVFSPSGGLDVGAVARHPLVMTSYETLRSKASEFRQISWSLVVLDEAQKVKSSKTQVSQVVKSLDTQFRIASTGTPVENSLSDLWSLMEFASPGRLGPEREFLKTFTPEKESEYDKLSGRIEELLGDRYLRRTKRDILHDLPPKLEHFPEVKMAGLQRSQYLGVTASAADLHPLEAILRLRQISCAAEGCLSNDNYEALACKLDWLIGLLEEIQKVGEKVLVFVEYKDTQRLIASALQHKFRIPVHMINGDVSTTATRSSKSRGELIAEFQNTPGFGVLVLSPLAAGFGLTLTEANHVVHFLRHWNPAKEDQATDRAFRIGQGRPVHVYYPAAVLQGAVSFDQRLSELLAAKRKLASSAIFPSMFGKVEFEELVDVLEVSEQQQHTARVRLEDLRLAPRHVKLGVVAALLRLEGLEVHRIQDGVGDLLARGQSSKSFYVKLATPEEPCIDAVWVSATYQKFCPTSLRTLVVLTEGTSPSQASDVWDSAKLEDLLQSSSVYWQDAYRPVREFEAPSSERQWEAVEGRLKRQWARRFDSTRQAPIEEDEVDEDSGSGALFSATSWAIDPAQRLVIEFSPMPNLPRFVKQFRIGNGSYVQELATAAMRKSRSYVEVPPLPGLFRFSAPGFEEEFDEELSDLALGLNSQLPTLFVVNRAGFGHPLRSRALSKGGKYHILLPPDFHSVPCPEDVQRKSLGSWTLVSLDLSEEPGPELALYLARLGFDTRGERTIIELLGPRLGDSRCPNISGRSLLLQLDVAGPAVLALGDGRSTSQLEVEEGRGQLFVADGLPLGGYVTSLTPRSRSLPIESLSFEIRRQRAAMPIANWAVQRQGQRISSGSLVSTEDLDLLEIHAPFGWPLGVRVHLTGEVREWKGEWQEPVALRGILEELAVADSMMDLIEQLQIEFPGVESVLLPFKGSQTVVSLRQRVARAHQRYLEASYTGRPSLQEVGRSFFLPVLELLGYSPLLQEQSFESTALVLELGPFSLRYALLVPGQVDPSSLEARALSATLSEATGVSRVLVSNGLWWSLHGRFVKLPVGLEAALDSEGAFEDFLSGFAAEEG